MNPPTDNSDAGKIFEIYDGPPDKKNFNRLVEVVCWDLVPGMVICKDVKTGSVLRIHRSKIEEANRKLAEEAAMEQS